MNSKVIQFIGLAATAVTIVANMVSDWASEKKMDEKIDERVNAALAKREGES